MIFPVLFSNCPLLSLTPQSESLIDNHLVFWSLGECLGRMKQEELGPQQQMLKDRVCECSVAFNSATPWTVVLQAPLSLEFSRQECWSRLPFPLRVSSQPRDPTCICRWSLHHWATWKTGESQEAVERLAAVWTNSERGRHKGNFSWGGREGKTAISG